MSDKNSMAKRAMFASILGLQLFSPPVVLADDENSAVAALKRAIQAADPKRA
jgi:hypothetical protein